MEPEGSLPQSQELLFVSQLDSFYREEMLAPRRTPQAGGPPFVGCPRLLIQFIHSYPPYWRPFLHPQPEDAPCRGDREPVITGILPLSYFMLKQSGKVTKKTPWP